MKQISEDLLARYFQSPPGFRREARNIPSGWALDGLFAFPMNMYNPESLLNKKHPLERLVLALENNYVSGKVSTELIDPKNWVYAERNDDNDSKLNYSWLFEKIDRSFLTSAFPCWVPGDIERMLLDALTYYYQYQDKKFDIDNNESHKYKITFSVDLVNRVKIVNHEGEVCIEGLGNTPLVAAYDLYEVAWKLNWEAEAPSITELEEVMDIDTNQDGEKVILLRSAYQLYGLNKKLAFYDMGKKSKYKNQHHYKGQYKFIEGEFEIFELPLYLNIKNVKDLFD